MKHDEEEFIQEIARRAELTLDAAHRAYRAIQSLQAQSANQPHTKFLQHLPNFTFSSDVAVA